MNRENYLKNLILEMSSIKEFSVKIGTPYTIILSILKNVGGASIDNIFKICRGLNISTDDLENCRMPSSSSLSSDEYKLIRNYRKLNDTGKVVAQGSIKALTTQEQFCTKIKSDEAI